MCINQKRYEQMKAEQAKAFQRALELPFEEVARQMAKAADFYSGSSWVNNATNLYYAAQNEAMSQLAKMVGVTHWPYLREFLEFDSPRQLASLHQRHTIDVTPWRRDTTVEQLRSGIHVVRERAPELVPA